VQIKVVELLAEEKMNFEIMLLLIYFHF